MRKWVVMSGVLGVVAVLSAGAAVADTASDRAAAIVIFPRVQSLVVRSPDRQRSTQLDGASTPLTVDVDTVIQISNTSNELVQLKCFYVNANSHCSVSGDVCNVPGAQRMACPLDDEVCQPGWTETDFHLTLTAYQPLAWRASRGLQADDLPLDGTFFRGPGGQSNAGSRVPPVKLESFFTGSILPRDVDAESFLGELKCVVVDAAGQAIARNVIKGEATTETLQVLEADSVQGLDNADVVLLATHLELPGADQYSAIGIQAIAGDANGDRILELGGDAGEYDGCPNVLIVDHFFDAPSRIPIIFPPSSAADLTETTASQVTNGAVSSSLTLVPCRQDLQAQIPGKVVAQYLVFNEFEQRFSTSTPIDCFYEQELSNIDTAQNNRSIFSRGVAGTVSGQTRIRGVGGGLVGVLREHFGQLLFLPTNGDSVGFGSVANIVAPLSSAAANLHSQGERAEADQIVVP